MKTIDLNADVGESSGASSAGDDEVLFGLVTSVHVACGFHAGDPEVMRRTVALAAAAGVAVGAHPSYPDSEGFGRRAIAVPLSRVVEDVMYQIGALDALARLEGARISSVKPHGALYHRLAVDEDCARAVAEGILAFGGGLRLVVPAGSSALRAGSAVGVATVAEAFCDRGYLADGSLVPRGSVGDVVSDPHEVARRAVRLALDGVAVALDGTELRLHPATLCIHGDNPAAGRIAAAVRKALAESGVVVASPRGE